MTSLKKRIDDLEKTYQPGAVPMVHYIYFDESGRPAYMDIPEAEFRAGQASGKYLPKEKLLELVVGEGEHD